MTWLPPPHECPTDRDLRYWREGLITGLIAGAATIGIVWMLRIFL